MTTNKPETFRFDCHGHSAPAYSCNKPADNSGEYVRLSDYEALQAECEKLRTLLAAAPDVQGEPVGRQYFQHGKWWNGDGLTKKQQKDLEEEGVRFRNVYAAPQPAKQPVEQQPAAKAQMEVVGWQFYQDGQWWNGDDRIKDHRKNTAAAGIPVRDLYATPQPAEQQPTCPTCLGGGWDIDCQNRFRPVTCPDCAGSGKFEHSITAQESDSVAPDVTALVEALESAKNLIANHSGEVLPDEYAGDQIEQMDAALAAYREGGEV